MKALIRDSAAVAAKELKQLSRDPVSLALTIMFPVLLISIFIVISAAFGATSYDLPVVIADLDSSPVSKILLDKLTISPLIHVAQFVQTEEQVLHAVESGAAVGGVVIPRGFGDALLNNQRTFVILQTDNSKIMVPSLVQAALSSSIQAMLGEASETGYSGALSGIKAASVELILRSVSGRPPSGDPILPGFLGMITILGAFDDIVNAISRERERGTFPRLVLTPVNILSVYLGKMGSTVLLNAIRTTLMLVIFVLSGLVIRGSLVLIYLITSLIAIFTLSVGLVFSSRIRSSATLTILEIALTFPLFQLSGAVSSPILLAPGGRAISWSLPWTWGNEALRRIIYLGVGIDAIAPNIGILLLSSLILLPIATVLAKRRM